MYFDKSLESCNMRFDSFFTSRNACRAAGARGTNRLKFKQNAVCTKVGKAMRLGCDFFRASGSTLVSFWLSSGGLLGSLVATLGRLRPLQEAPKKPEWTTDNPKDCPLGVQRHLQENPQILWELFMLSWGAPGPPKRFSRQG